MALLQEITGHKTGEIVLKHYNKPRRDQLKAAVQKALPAALVGAAPAAPVAALPPAGDDVLEGEAVEVQGEAGDGRAQRIADALAGVDKATLAKIEKLLKQAAGRKPRRGGK